MQLSADIGHGGRRRGAGRPRGVANTSKDVRQRFNEARADKEEALARKAKMEADEKEGALIDAKVAADRSRRTGIAVRDGVLSVPARICNDLAAMDDAGEIERFLTAALREELTRLADLGPEGAR